MTLIKLQKAWGIGLFLQWQQLITGLGANGEFASSISSRRFSFVFFKRKAATSRRTPKAAAISSQVVDGTVLPGLIKNWKRLASKPKNRQERKSGRRQFARSLALQSVGYDLEYRCPHCSTSYGEGDLLFKGGIQLTNPEVIGSLVWWHALANRSMESAIAIPKFPFVPHLQ